MSSVVRACAIFRDSIRYTVPCASGAPPSSAPDTYHARKTCSFQPISVVVASVNVPTP